MRKVVHSNALRSEAWELVDLELQDLLPADLNWSFDILGTVVWAILGP